MDTHFDHLNNWRRVRGLPSVRPSPRRPVPTQETLLGGGNYCVSCGGANDRHRLGCPVKARRHG